MSFCVPLRLRRERFKPRRQDPQTNKKVPQRLHPLCPPRPKLVLMQVAMIAASDSEQLCNDVVDRCLPARQQTSDAPQLCFGP